MAMNVPDQAAEAFEEQFGAEKPYFCARAPGRVNLIGEHTDYNGGFVMPMAVDRSVWSVFRPTEGREVRLWSVNYEEEDSFSLDDIEKSDEHAWSNYVRGVARVLQDAGHSLQAFEAAIYGNVPIGAGLSSSAAMEVSSALAFCSASDLEIPAKELALLCQKAENNFVGVNCGIMDQFVSLYAQQDRAVLIDCRSLDHRLLPMNTDTVRVIVCDTNVHHELGDSAYNERRASCERAAAALGEVMAGVEQLRDVSRDQFKQYSHVLNDITLKRARHVVTENGRVRWAVEKLEDEDYEGFGQLMNASHDSLRDDYEVSCEELDLMVDIARAQEGTLGARMTGAGFGGCTVNLVRRENAEKFQEVVGQKYEEETGIEPDIYECRAASGAEVEQM